jgi:Domain of unknown function (DUF4396)
VFEGVMLLWFVLTALSMLFVAVDIRSTPEAPVLKWGFVLITAYTGPVGAFLYVLGCREPLPGLHERYVAARWRQVLGSTMHCVAGDGLGILAGAVVGALAHMPVMAEVALEYVLGFAFGWTIFQSLFMRRMAGGSYRRALSGTFVPELLSMNLLMAGMVPVMILAMRSVTGSRDPSAGAFWFRMSMALLVGFAAAYPMNWWLVSHHLKHGMMTVRRPETARAMRSEAQPETEQQTMGDVRAAKPTAAATMKMAILSIAMLAVGIAASVIFSVRR